MLNKWHKKCETPPWKYCPVSDCRSGTEENYSELTQLLEDIFTYQREMQTALSTEKEGPGC